MSSTPPAFELLADQPFLPRGSNGTAAVGTTQTETKRLWRHFLLGGTPALLGEGRAALFVGTGESGSCPIEVTDVKVDPPVVQIETEDHDGPCTADFRPRTFVFGIDGSVAPKIHRVEIEGVSLRVRRQTGGG